MRLSGSAPPNCNFTFDGRPIAAVKGESIAAALTAAGVKALGAARDGEARGVFCGMGVCQECLVVVDGRAGMRACSTAVADGMTVLPQPALPDAAALAPLAAPPESIGRVAPDVLVVGAGPAGLETARVAAEAGLAVLVLDEPAAPGGQFYKQPEGAPAIGWDRQFRDGRDLIARTRAAGAVVLSGATVWGGARGADGGLEIAFLAGETRIAAPKVLVIATGAYEVPPPVPGWTLPGVMTVGAAQTLIRRYGVAPGRRVLFAGRGPLDLQVAAEIRRGGGTVVALAQASTAPFMSPVAGARLAIAHPALAMKGAATLAALRGIPIHWSHAVRRLEGEGRVERAVLAPLLPDGRLADGPDIVVPADAVCLGGNFHPAHELARLLGCTHRPVAGPFPHLVTVRDDEGRTSQDDVFVVGEAGGFGGAFIALAHGALAAVAIARRLDRPVPPDVAPFARRRLARHRRFQEALWSLFAAPARGPIEDETRLCRCEGVTLAALRAAAAGGAADMATLKRLTRAGMGRCQGRYCGPGLHDVASAVSPASGTANAAQGETESLAPQMPLRPVPIAALRLEKPEWGGHRRSLLPPAPAGMAEPFGDLTATTVVIGSGIVGVATAYFLAKSGHDVVVLERGRINAMASGGNAGSLHAQLLSFDYGAKAEAGGGPALMTLPLQQASIALWQALEAEIDGRFEMKITGGLMVAETDDELRFLEAKSALERRHGIACEVISAQEALAMEPALLPGLIGAAWCPGEGKINPLVATAQVAAAARRFGARIHDRTGVTAIERVAGGFRLATGRGSVRATHVVNAAGAFASEIGAMLGVNVPVHGAPLQMIVTEPVAPLVSRLVAHASRHLTLKQADNGTVLIGGGWTAGLDPVHRHPRPSLSSIEGNLWIAGHVIPALSRLRVVRTWAAMNINIDGSPILGEHPDVPGFFNAVTSNGYTLGPICGRITAACILDGRSDWDIAPFSIARFAW